MNIATPPLTNRDGWLEEVQNIADGCQTMHELRAATSVIWDMRHCDGVVPGSIGIFRTRAQRLDPGYQRQKVAAIDFNSVVNTGIHIGPQIPEQMLGTIAAKVNADRIILCGDGSNVWRWEQMESYKESRPDSKPDGFKEAWDLALGSSKLCVDDRYEADDLLATIAFQCQVLGQPVTLASKDSDMWQCLGAQTTIWDFGKKKFIGAPWLQAEHRIAAKQVVDWNCLTGSKNDVPGCNGIGKKTASDLLEAFGSVVGIWDHRDSLTPARRTNFTEFFNKQYWSVREIHTLCRTCHIKQDFWK